MVFSPSRKKVTYNFTLKIENSPIEKVSQTKFLGVLLDEHLTWKPHINYIKSKMCKSIGIINRAKPYLNKQSLRCLYFSFMYPYLIYCVTIWGGSNVSTILPVVRTQKRALRCIFSVSKDTPSLPLFHELNVLQFSKVYELQML